MRTPADAGRGSRDCDIGLYYEPLLLATIARSELALGEPDDALAAAEAAVEIMNARGLTTCALPRRSRSRRS